MEYNIEIDAYCLDMLKKVIDLYISTGNPVSSSKVKKIYSLDISTAKIRNILHTLEEQGFLYRPHISSGRVPTDLGYRIYVDEIKGENQMSRVLIDEITRQLRQDWSDVRGVMERTSRLLSDLTNYLGLIMGRFSPSNVIDSIKIYRHEGRMGVVVIKLRQLKERIVYIEFPEMYSTFIIDYAVQKINEMVVGLNVEDAVTRLRFLLDGGVGDEREIAELVSKELSNLIYSSTELIYHFGNKLDCIATLEFNEPKALKNLVSIMGERNLLIDLMKRRMGDELTVTIGSENEFEELEDFSLITKKFTTYAGDGILGVLGPTRMSYGMVMALLRYFASELNMVEIY